MAILPCLVDVSFPEPLLAKPLEKVLMNGTTRIQPPTTLEEVVNDEEPPVHPFARAKDTAYAPPTTNNISVKPKPSLLKKPDIPLRTTAPIYNPQMASKVYAQMMDSQITITQRELLSLLPEVRNQVHEATSNRCIIRTGTVPTPVDQNLLDVSGHIEVTDNEDDHARHEVSRLAAMPVMYSAMVQSLTMKALSPALSNAKPPPGAIIIEDPYQVYLRTTLEDRSPDCLMIAKESSALHTILPLINHNQYVESVLDPGSQVIAMLEATCHVLALIYDPHIRLHMQLANQEVDETLGLARNVPILVGDIMLYIQFHIIRNPTYNVLLGQPFNILVKSIIWNYSNEDQMIMIHDPTSGRIVTVPTFPWGTHLCTARPSPDFCNLRI